MARKKINRSLGGNLTIFIMLTFFGIFMALPMVYTIVNAFKPLDELFMFPPRFFVRRPTMDNFLMLFQLTSNLWVTFTRYIFNSTFVTVLATAGSVILSSMAAYPLSKHVFPGKKTLFSMVILALLFNGSVLGIPQYVIMAKLKLIDSYFGLILPFVASSLGLFLMKQFIDQFPNDVLESARIDGIGEFKIFWYVVMPNVKPGWLTLTIFAFQAIWNYTGAGIVYNESLKLLPTVLSQIGTAGIARAGVASAAGLFLVVPPVILFLITQSKVIETMMYSGIKD